MAIPKKIRSINDILKNIETNIYYAQDSENFMKLASFMLEHSKEPSRHIASYDQELLKWIMKMTSMLDSRDFNYSIATRIHWILMGFTDFPECENPECHNIIGVKTNIVWCRGYTRYCSLKCGTKCSRDKCNKTLHRHAAENPDFFKQIENKKKTTRLEKHGDPTWNNRASAMQTCLDKYGSTAPVGNKDIYAKSMETRERKYGKGNLTNYAKTADTCLRLYGHRSAWGNPDIHRKCIERTIELHGSPNPGNKYSFDGFKFDSKPELAFYIWLKDNNIDFICKPDIRFPYKYNEKTYYYFPDFVVEEHIVEIKGDHFFKEDGTMQNPFDHSQDGLYEAKHQCMLDNNVNIMRTSEYSQYLEYVNDTYGKHHLESFKMNRS